MRTSNFFGKKVVVANFAMAIFGWGIGFLWAANIHVCRHLLIMFNASTGIDFVEEAVGRATAKAKAAGLNIDFMVKDFFTIGSWDRKFQTIIDSGLFHIFSGDEVRKAAYLDIVSKLLSDNGRLYILACKKETGIDAGVNADEIFETFRERFIVESLHEFEAETVIGAAENVPDKQWLSYFAVIKKR
ncbi:class I SAM-dependent methyltransferase [Rahnella aquatilis]|uniref:class I SAM-dependent methyltransferase n=1 Tax=Rahnella aquatilis TaxID=34038 RepID=UPI0036477833